MTIPRRRLLRRQLTEPASNPRQQARAQGQRAELVKSRTALKRWLTRLKRATNTVATLHARIGRLENQLGPAAG
jgi:hypothetical protein